MRRGHASQGGAQKQGVGGAAPMALPMIPVGAVLVAIHENRRRVHRCPQRARTPLTLRVFPCKPAEESIAAPKGHGPRTLRLFPLQTGLFRGPLDGAMIAIVDP